MGGRRWRWRKRGSARAFSCPSHPFPCDHPPRSQQQPDTTPRRLAIIESFCPKLADADQTRKWVEEAIAKIGASKPGDVGKARCPDLVASVSGLEGVWAHRTSAECDRPCPQVIGAVLKAHKGEVDNATVKAEAEKILGK